MAGAVKFDDLALQYVLSDEPEQAKSAAETAASMIEASANNRVLVGQWVSSINRWMPSGNSGDDGLDDNGEGQDDDFISRAKALGFLASTLGALKRDTLKADQVQLLISFFCSLFSSDHKAGITASAKALRQLTSMKMFKPPMGNDIIEGVCKLGDDFKLQAPATRLEIYQLVLGLLQDPSVSNDLEYQHGSTCGFMTGLLDLCRNERDPNNLMKWFDTLKTFLQTFSPSPEVTSEVFKTFSAYFPISLRTSATPSGITADDLKGAVRACFSAHHRLAGQAIPFLIGKLDQGDAVTVSVKVDILQTLDACLNQYAHPKQSVAPFADQIWSSLKYEVRNGEASDAIEATLKAISSLTRRLDEDDLRSFFNNAWRDIAEDISTPTYAAQAGRLLVGIVGASVNSFSMITPALSQVQTTVKTSKSATHRRDLLALLNSILLVRSHLVSSEGVSQSLEDPLKDQVFGDALFFDVHLPLWKEIPTSYTPTEQVEILSKVMEGLAALVGQQSYGAEPRRLLSDSTCTHIFNLLSGPSITYPLKAESFTGTNQSAADEQLRGSASSALKKAVPLYPQGFQQLLLQYLASLGLLAASVIRALDEGEQKALQIDQEAFVLFRGDDQTTDDMTRAALDTTWAILSNKFVIKGDDRKSDWLALQEEIKTAFVMIWNSDKDSAPEIPDAVRVFRSILHFLSGDIARFQTDPKMNSLLRLVCDEAPSNPAMGRQLARNFGLLVSPKECLQRENHAVRKRLGEAWIYHQVVQPHLGECFPGSAGDGSSSVRGQQEQEQDAVSRAVATFALLRHARYEHYADDVAQIVRIAIRSLGTLEFRGAEMESCLVVLVGILEKDPEALKDHLAGLTRGLIKVYTEAKALAAGPRDEALSPRDANSLNMCRKLVLDFFRKLPAIYEAHSLLPYRNQLLRPLSLSCGDPVREIRRTALAARQAWENLG
ncbi:hypothetical protein DL767_000792 [Monosporascus sp. MG133]|nr:hypothetical protein DL767_000792 [Monosporascus sp. MG133]